MTKRKPKQQQLLKKQRLSKRKKHRLLKNLTRNPKLLKYTCILALAGGLFFFKDQFGSSTSSLQEIILPPSNPRITISPELTNEQKKLIRHEIQLLQEPDTYQVKEIILSIQNSLGAARVNLIKLSNENIKILIKFHEAIAEIEPKSSYYLTQEAKIIPKKFEISKVLPKLKGLKIDVKNQTKDSLIKKDLLFNQTYADEAQHLINLSHQYNLSYSEIDLNPYRGFRVTIRGKKINIQLGRAPFEKKLNRIRKILDDLYSKGKYSANIEVDFDGKAFIQELES